MNQISDNVKYQIITPSMKGKNNVLEPDHNIRAHYSNNMKLPKPNPKTAEVPSTLPSKSIIQTLNNEATEKLKKINMDIYTGTKKERAKHDFDFSLYLKIFLGILLTITGITCYGKIRNIFKKS